MTHQDMAQLEAGILSLCNRVKKENIPVSVMHFSSENASHLESFFEMVQSDNLGRLIRHGSDCCILIPGVSKADAEDIVSNLRGMDPGAKIAYQGYDPLLIDPVYQGGDAKPPMCPDLADYLPEKR